MAIILEGHLHVRFLGGIRLRYLIYLNFRLLVSFARMIPFRRTSCSSCVIRTIKMHLFFLFQ